MTWATAWGTARCVAQYTVRHSAAQRGTGHSRAAQRTAWCTARHSMAWQCDASQYGISQHGPAWHGTAPRSMAPRGTARHGTAPGPPPAAAAPVPGPRTANGPARAAPSRLSPTAHRVRSAEPPPHPALSTLSRHSAAPRGTHGAPRGGCHSPPPLPRWCQGRYQGQGTVTVLLGAASPQQAYMSKLRLQTGPGGCGGVRVSPVSRWCPTLSPLTGCRGVQAQAQLAGVPVLAPGGQRRLG